MKIADYQKLKKKLNQCIKNYESLLTDRELQKNNYQKYTQLLILQQEDDRKEISRELHDEIGQILTGINFKLSILSKKASHSVQDLKDSIVETQQLVQKSTDSIYQFAKNLRPFVLDDLGLEFAIRSLVIDINSESKTIIYLTIQKNLPILSDFLKTIIFRVIQESVANFRKHANATHAKITIRYTKKYINVCIYNNGNFFIVKKKSNLLQSKRTGLLGLQERVNMVNGLLTINSTKQKGTTVNAKFPM